jgi:predicted secreted protein
MKNLTHPAGRDIIAVLVWSALCIFQTSAMSELRPAPAGEAPSAASTTIQWEGDEAVYRFEPWEMRITYLNKGTRSEGQRGILKRSGQLVEPDETNLPVETPFGMVKHYGAERPQEWSVSGWNFSERRSIKRSEKVETTDSSTPSVTVDLNPTGLVTVVTIHVGQQLSIALMEQAGTGYHWTLADEERLSDGLRFAGKTRADGKTDRLGGSTPVRFDFTAINPGEYRLRFLHQRPFNKNEPDSEARTVRVRVE